MVRNPTYVTIRERPDGSIGDAQNQQNWVKFQYKSTTLWFFDKSKTDERVLFIDTRNIFIQIDRAHREFSAEQIQNIAIISRLHKGRRDEGPFRADGLQGRSE